MAKNRFAGYDILAKHSGFIAVDIPSYNRIDIEKVRRGRNVLSASKATIYKDSIQIYARDVRDVEIITTLIKKILR